MINKFSVAAPLESLVKFFFNLKMVEYGAFNFCFHFMATWQFVLE